MENWVIIGLFVGCGALELASSLVLWYVLKKQLLVQQVNLETLHERISILEGEAEEEAQEKHERLSFQGQRGATVREDNRAMRNEAMKEGRALISQLGPGLVSGNPEDLAQGKAALVQLTMKYPKHAEEVADALISEMHAEKYGGMIKSVISAVLQGQLVAPAPTPQGPPLFG